MTAEIVVTNREAVALAADSAVTARLGGTEKTSTSANKLFALSSHHPVGIMIYGNALFMNVPWETIIKVYRKTSLPKNGFASLEEYAEDFISFLRYNNIPFPDVAEDNYICGFVGAVIAEIREEILEHVGRAIRDGSVRERSDFEESVNRFAQEVIQEKYEYYRRETPLFPVRHASAVLRKYQQDVNAMIKAISSEFNLGTELRLMMRRVLRHALARSFIEDLYSGVVIAGFGERDIFPAVRAYKVEGIIRYESKGQSNELLKHSRDEAHSAPGNLEAGVIAIAQPDMICRFMDGVDPGYRNAEKGLLRGLCDDFIDKVVRQLSKYSDAEKERIRQQLKAYGDGLVREFASSLKDFVTEYFSNPTVAAVSRLPKNELATMAEALVHLTSLKRRVSPDPETVAEPIDVAVISKGEGFIWIRRKHYFDANMNPQFFLTRLKEMIDEGKRNSTSASAQGD